MRNFARLVCVCVCVRVWERERVIAQRRLYVCVCVCVCLCERGRYGHTTAACVQTHTSFITVSVTRLCSPLGLELMVKLRTLLTVFTIILKAEARDYGKGTLHFQTRLVVFALCQLANPSRLQMTPLNYDKFSMVSISISYLNYQ